MINILHDQLFTAVELEGETKRLGLLDLLAEAHCFSDLKANSCTGKFALIRLCIAFLVDAYRPQDTYDRGDLLKEGCFDREKLEQYVAGCEAKGACFVLDDARRPFMQTAYDDKLDESAEKPVSKIMFDCPSGNNHIHCDHRHEDEHESDAAAAFVNMLETYLFCPAGLSGASNVNNTPPIYALIHGSNLFETLVLNMVSEDELSNIPFGAGEVAWMRNERINPGEKVVNMSLLKALTWQPRRLTLLWDEDGMVRRVLLQNGLNFQGNMLWKDPHALFRKTKDDSWTTVKPELGREIWRDAGSLVTGGSSTRTTVPFMNINQVWDECPSWLDAELIGLVTNQESVLGRVNERLRLPRELFEREELAAEFRNVLNQTETMYRNLIKDVSWQFGHASDKKRRSVVAEQAGEIYLYSMHEVVFGQYLDELLASVPALDRITHFIDAIWKAVNEALAEAVDTTGNDVLTMKRQNAVRAAVRKDYMEIRKELRLE